MASKASRYKPYDEFSLLLIPTYCQKDFSIDFITGLSVSFKCKGKTYNSILIIIDQLTKIVHYKLIKVTIDFLGLAKVSIDVIVRYYSLPNLIVSNHGSVFIFQLYSSLCYFLGIKRRLYIAFHLLTNGQTKRQNITVEPFL